MLHVATVLLAAGAGIDPPAAAGAMAPDFAAGSGPPLLTWLEPAGEPEGERWRLRFARFDAGEWSAPRTIAERGDFFVNWADVPSAAVAKGGTLYAHWLQKSGEDVYAYDVVLARSADAGETWRVLGPVHDDGTETEHGFCSLLPAPGGGVHAFWLDGREMPGGGGMTLRAARVDGSIGAGVVVDDRVCECCSTSAVMTAGGPVVFYRDRGVEEVRDIFTVRRDGEGWTTPRAVHDDGWLIAACPVNGPAAAARGDVVAVAWFTGAAGRGAVRAARSSDGGATFAAPITIDATMPVGRVDLLLDPSGDAIVSWLDGDGAVKLRRAGRDGRLGPAVKVAESSTRRAAGFARTALAGVEVLVVWTEDGAPGRLRAAAVPLDGIPR